MATYNIELNSNAILGSNEHTLMLRITHDRKHARLKLDYAIHPKHFNNRPKHNQYVRQTHPKATKINSHIEKRIQQAKDAAEELADQGQSVTAETIKQRLSKPEVKSFYQFTEDRITEMKKNQEVSSAARYNSVLTKIKNFKGEKELDFQEIDVSFLDDFQQYLKTLNNTQNTIHSNLRVIRALIYKAISKGLIKNENNPFSNYKLKPGIVNKVRLDEQEICKIEELKLVERSLIWHVKNAFLFSYYCAGIRISDILQLKWKNVVGERLIFVMHKTKQGQSIKILDKPKRILEFYVNGKDSENFIFPFFEKEIDYLNAEILRREIGRKTALVNKYLKKISDLAEIDKKITTHTARHSFADIARQKTNNLYNLSKTLGHSSLKITEAYLASFDEKAVDDTLDEVFK